MMARSQLAFWAGTVSSIIWIALPLPLIHRCGRGYASRPPHASGAGFTVETDQGSYHSRNVVVATSIFHQPHIPACAARLPPEIVQRHSDQYRNPEQLPPGAALVVGSGQSGTQVMDELVIELMEDDWQPPEAPGQLSLADTGITAVIWATGYRFNFNWIKGVELDKFGYPVQEQGVSSLPGLYFVGLHRLNKFKSGLLYGVAEDAAHVAEQIGKRQPVPAHRSTRSVRLLTLRSEDRPQNSNGDGISEAHRFPPTRSVHSSIYPSRCQWASLTVRSPTA
jgi:hypothetical protein